MHFLTCLFTFISLSPFALASLSNLQDIYDISQLQANTFITLDTKEFLKFESFYIPSAIFSGKTLGVPDANGVKAIEAAGVALFPNGTVSQDAVTTQTITLAHPLDKLHGVQGATAIIYLTTTYFGTGNLTGQIGTLYSRLDDTYVKTSGSGFGGWRVEKRILELFVRFVLSIPLFPLLPGISDFYRNMIIAN